MKRLIPPGQGRGLLVLGDNLSLCSALPEGVADLIVADPPFHTGRARVGSAPSTAGQQEAESKDARPASFGDRWESPDAYLAFLRPRLQALHRMLAPQGSLVVHLDQRAVHEVKIELDGIFGRRRFINEIIWHYTGGGRSRRYFSRKHDTLLWYARGDGWTFNIDAVRVPYHPNSGSRRMDPGRSPH